MSTTEHEVDGDLITVTLKDFESDEDKYCFTCFWSFGESTGKEKRYTAQFDAVDLVDISAHIERTKSDAVTDAQDRYLRWKAIQSA